MDGGAWWAAVHGVAKSRTRLSDFTTYMDMYKSWCLYCLGMQINLRLLLIFVTENV